jgi:GNAT superfamily N-acetyltransferase
MPQRDNKPTLRPARVEECEALSSLCLRSKAVWGYDTAFMEACRAELTLRPDDLSNVQVAERAGQILGLAQVALAGDIAQLEKLFVEPSSLRSGVGRHLFAWARDTAMREGARVLIIESDLCAAEFYRRMGARDDGFAPSGSIACRMLPRLKLPLT